MWKCIRGRKDIFLFLIVNMPVIVPLLLKTLSSSDISYFNIISSENLASSGKVVNCNPKVYVLVVY